MMWFLRLALQFLKTERNSARIANKNTPFARTLRGRKVRAKGVFLLVFNYSVDLNI